MISYVGFDTETHRIGPEAVAPKIICLTLAAEHPHFRGLYTHADGNLSTVLANLFLPDPNPEEESIHLIGHNTKYDLAVIAAEQPDLIPLIFDALEDGRIHDTFVREKLLNLASDGQLDKRTNPDGSTEKIRHDLASLVFRYLAKDISATKGKDGWRLRYNELENIPTAQWPVEARDYPLDDAILPVQVFHAQEKRRQEIISRKNIDPFTCETFRVCTSFVLQLMTCYGSMVDPQEYYKIKAMLEEELRPEKMNLLLKEGIWVPGSDPQPYANGAQTHTENCPRKTGVKMLIDGKMVKAKKCNCPVKMTSATKESISKVKLTSYVEQLAKRNPEVELKRTAKTEMFPEGQVSIDAEFLEDYYHLDPVLEQYKHRQDLQKLVTTELPRMTIEVADANSPTGKKAVPARIVHPCYDILKSTGRTSSFADKLFPSYNCQNVDPRARGMIIPRPGWLLYSCDYSAMELVSLAIKCRSLFGYSVLADNFAKGIDPHAYLGSKIAYATDNTFAASCNSDPYDTFIKLKAGTDEQKEFFKHYRKLAKPTGLGYPGGLGAKTFVKYAKATYDVIISVETATQLQDIWHATYPEMKDYFRYVNTECVDPFNGPIIKKVEGKDGLPTERKSNLYHYTSPMGLYRAGADYCACANGIGLQTPSADGALMALYVVGRECYDPSLQSCMYGTQRPTKFVHDEIIGEVVDDQSPVWKGSIPPGTTQGAMNRLGIVMGSEWNRVMDSLVPEGQSVKIKAQPVLMRRWNKDAEAVFDKDGRLIPWEPKAAERKAA